MCLVYWFISYSCVKLKLEFNPQSLFNQAPNPVHPSPLSSCLLALRSIQFMTGEARPRYSVLQLIGECGAYARNCLEPLTSKYKALYYVMSYLYFCKSPIWLPSFGPICTQYIPMIMFTICQVLCFLWFGSGQMHPYSSCKLKYTIVSGSV